MTPHSAETKLSFKLLISGRVQGVWYRAKTREKAASLGLTGWVRNLSDGKVECFAHGPQSMLQELLEWCKVGPKMANVDEIDVTEGEYSDEYTDFSITG